ncbi:MAG: hypothetical protein ACRET2_04825 [Steroidobacteraceae bacterium]
MFKPTFQPSECLKALTYFRGGDLETLSELDRNRLVQAVRAVRDLPEVALLSRELEPVSVSERVRDRDSGLGL